MRELEVGPVAGSLREFELRNELEAVELVKTTCASVAPKKWQNRGFGRFQPWTMSSNPKKPEIHLGKKGRGKQLETEIRIRLGEQKGKTTENPSRKKGVRKAVEN